MNRGHASRLAPSLWPNDSAEPTPWSRSKEGNGHAPSPSDGRSAPAAGRLLRWLVTTPFSLREGQRISFLLGTRTRSASATASAIALKRRSAARERWRRARRGPEDAARGFRPMRGSEPAGFLRVRQSARRSRAAAGPSRGFAPLMGERGRICIREGRRGGSTGAGSLRGT